MKKLIFALSLVTIMNSAVFAGAQEAMLEKLHRSYITKNHGAVFKEAKSLLMNYPYDPIVTQNVLEVVEKVKQNNSLSGIDFGYQLPDSVQMFVVYTRMKKYLNQNYNLTISGTNTVAQNISQFKLTRYPDEVLYDTASDVGELTEEFDQKNKEYNFSIKGKPTRNRAKEGLYLFNLVTKNGDETKGWFILTSSDIAEETPTLVTPNTNQVVKDTNPEITWNDFKSSKYKPEEFRAVSVTVIKNDGDKYPDVWGMFDSHSALTSVKIGSSAPESYGANKLEDGSYSTILAYRERVMVGPIWVGRMHITQRDFMVKK